MKKGQAWSLELTATITLFMVALVIFGALILKKDSSGTELSLEAEKTANYLSSDSKNAIIDNSVVDKSKAATLNYTSIKKDLRIKNSVCIYFEDKDGRIIQLNGKEAIGDSDVLVNGKPCSNNS